jgi:riboflavin biosynthesis pyrimidine reductase
MTTRKKLEDPGGSPRPLVTAAFTLSWDGRIIGHRPPARAVDATLHESESDEPNTAGAAARVLIHARARLNPGGVLFQAGSQTVIVYASARLPQATRKALESIPQVRLHMRPQGPWPLREALEHLRATHGLQRLAFAGGPELFRHLITEDLLDQLSLAWRPTIAGAKTPTITGPDKHFLPRGITLDLLKLKRTPNECVAQYRVQAPAQPR